MKIANLASKTNQEQGGRLFRVYLEAPVKVDITASRLDHDSEWVITVGNERHTMASDSRNSEVWIEMMRRTREVLGLAMDELS